MRYGLWPSLLASVAASLCYNFFFLPPIYTFTITDPTNVAAFVFFTVVAVVVSHFAARGRTQTVAAHERVRAVESLYAFSRKLAGVGTLDDVLWATAYQTALMLKVRVVLLLPENGSIAVKAGYPPEDTLDEADLAAAKWAWENNRAAGRGSDTLPGAKRLFLPMRTGRGAIGVIGIDSDKPGPLLTPDQRRLLDALIDQGALAIERVHLVEDVDRAKRTVETDRLRSALLTSISHDLKTPLAAVLGAAGTLRDLSSRADRRRKGRPARDHHRRIGAAQSLHRQPARHDQARIRRHRAERRPPRSRRDRRQRAAARGQDSGRAIASNWSLHPALPMVELDAVLFEQVLFNLLDNAAKYSPAGTTVRIQSWRDRDAVCLQVLDEGDGIPPADLEHIFDKFYRVEKGDQVRAGTGLGLAISRGFVEAMHGTITAANRTDRSGAVFTIRLPDSTRGRAIGHRRMSAAPLKVLVVDDEPPIRKLLRMGLSTQGYEILEAPNGKACARAAGAEPDLIILDLGLPDIQGLELLRMIRARNESVPIVVLSSRGDEAGKVAGARSRRRRLRHQAVRHGRAARPHARGAAPSASGARRAADLPRRRLSVDLVRRIVKVARQGGEALAQGVRASARAGAACRQGADPQVPAR